MYGLVAKMHKTFISRKKYPNGMTALTKGNIALNSSRFLSLHLNNDHIFIS